MSLAEKELYEFSNFRLNVAERILMRGEERVYVPAKVFETLCVLVRHGGELVSKDRLMEEIWRETIVEENNLDKNISALRKILGERTSGEKFIETVRGYGYRFTAGARRVEIEKRAAKTAQPEDLQIPPPKTADNHHYTTERRGNVIAVADWQIGRESKPQKFVGQDAPIDSGDSIGENAPTTIAALPFKLINFALTEQYLGAGLADALIVGLSKIGNLLVRPTASVLPFADAGTNALDAGRALKVEIVLDGKIVKVGNCLRVTVEALRVADGALLWAEQFDGAANDIFRIEDELTVFAAAELRKLTNSDAPFHPHNRGTRSLAAYRAYLQARFYFHQGKFETYQNANAFFREAIRLDENFAEAYAGLADNLVAETIFMMRPPPETSAEAEKAVRKAFELNASSAEVISALANFNLSFNFDLAKAERFARQAVRLNRSSANAYNLLGQALMFQGSFADAEIALRQALEIDPLGFWHLCALNVLYFLRRDYEQVIREVTELLAFNPKLVSEPIKQCWALTELGKYSEALTFYEEIKACEGGEICVAWFIGYTQAVAGDAEKARATLARLEAMSAQMYVSPYFFALVYGGLKETERAISHLEEAAANRDPWTIWTATDPRLDNLRLHPRFQSLVSRIVPEQMQAQQNSLQKRSLQR